MLSLLLLQDVCKIVMNYCRILKGRVRLLSENSDPATAINMASVAKFLRTDPLSKRQTLSNFCPPVALRCGQRLGAPPLGADSAPHAAELGGAS